MELRRRSLEFMLRQLVAEESPLPQKFFGDVQMIRNNLTRAQMITFLHRYSSHEHDHTHPNDHTT